MEMDLEKEFYEAFKMVLGVGEKKAKKLSEVAMQVVLKLAAKTVKVKNKVTQ